MAEDTKVLGSTTELTKQTLLTFIRESLECFEVLDGPDYVYLKEILPEETLVDIRRAKIIFNIAEDALTPMEVREVEGYVSSYE